MVAFNVLNTTEATDFTPPMCERCGQTTATTLCFSCLLALCSGTILHSMVLKYAECNKLLHQGQFATHSLVEVNKARLVNLTDLRNRIKLTCESDSSDRTRSVGL